MEIRTLGAVSIADPSQVAEARRFALGLARGLDFNEAESGRLGIVVTEAATNVWKHAREGELIFSALANGERQGLSVLALDKGPGIRNVAESLRNGYSTAGSPGTGLGAMTRLTSSLDLYTQAGGGTALLARIWAGGHRDDDPPRGPMACGAVSLALAGEPVCGDAWSLRAQGTQTSILLADGLGHGFQAAEAASEAVRVFRRHSGHPAEVLAVLHDALRHTRGAAAAIAEIDSASRSVRYAGVGNISAVIAGGEREHNLVSHNGTLGLEIRRVQEFSAAWPHDAALIMHSDGLSRRWDLHRYPGLLAHRPALIAGVLYRDFRRERDDATVVVARDVMPGGNG